MFPWKPNEFIEVVAGRKLLPLLLELLQLRGGEHPGRDTLRKILDLDMSVKSSTLEMVLHPRGKKFWEESRLDPDGPVRGYEEFFECLFEAMKTAGSEDWPGLLYALRHFVSAGLWVEGEWYRFLVDKIEPTLDRHPFVFASEELVQWLKNSPSGKADWASLNRYLELSSLCLYAAAIEVDFDEIEERGGVSLPVPSLFLPSFLGGRVRYPMWSFFTWLKLELGVPGWKELGEKWAVRRVCDGAPGLAKSTERIRIWANTKTLEIRWEHILDLASRVDDSEDPEIWGPRSVRIFCGFVWARLMQFHAIRRRSWPEPYCDYDEETESFYLAEIKRAKERVKEGIPLHPLIVASD